MRPLRKRLPVIDWSAVIVVLLVPVLVTLLCAAAGGVLVGR